MEGEHLRFIQKLRQESSLSGLPYLREVWDCRGSSMRTWNLTILRVTLKARRHCVYREHILAEKTWFRNKCSCSHGSHMGDQSHVMPWGIPKMSKSESLPKNTSSGKWIFLQFLKRLKSFARGKEAGDKEAVTTLRLFSSPGSWAAPLVWTGHGCGIIVNQRPTELWRWPLPATSDTWGQVHRSRRRSVWSADAGEAWHGRGPRGVWKSAAGLFSVFHFGFQIWNVAPVLCMSWAEVGRRKEKR